MADIKSMFNKMSSPKQNGTGEPAPAKGQKGAIEKIYQKKSQLEHILLRPDTYIGSVERATETMWVYDKVKECMMQKELTSVPDCSFPGLYKIYDEILVNAADNKQRDPKMDVIKIDINQETNTISVYNNGSGIPVVMHKDEKMYVPTMIFGHLLTSSNYNDEEEKVTGGRNGYGAKLCNIFSTKFTVETASKQYKKHFKQTWGSNMTKASEPKIKDSGKDDDFTKIVFSPDLAKFKMEKLEDDIVLLMSRRAYDVAASSQGVKVYLNGERLKINKFKDYVDLYIKGKDDENGQPLKVVYEKVSDRWEVALTISDMGFQQVSFVNSIATTKGGKHVDTVADSVVKNVLEVLKKKNKGGVNIKPYQVKTHMWLFVNCLIVNPTFDSQTKENMTLQAKSFGSKCNLSEKFITAVTKCGLVESVLTWAKFKAQDQLVKASGKKQSKLKGIPKLEDANDAGTKNAHLCTLILTEGDSAKTLAVSGLSVVGRDHYGVFPLEGKPLNVRDASHKQVLENVEINNLIKILGLQYKKKYNSVDDLKTLRYGKVMIMADQDQDGSHIKGLIINFIHHNWPELLKLPFLEEFITPIVKATKKDKEISFYSLPEFEEWKKETENHHTYNIKYYKGLGTSTSKEAKEYFQNMDRHRIRFKYSGPTDDHHIELAFSKKGADQRKEWLTNHMDEVKRRKEIGLSERYLYTKETKTVTYSDFVNLELVLFSNGDNVRSIPSMIDGLKPGQRKVIFTCIKRNDKREVKVAQLAGSVAEHSAYHHGEQSLAMTIVNLAQNYVGSNNINLLEPRGQFGTRLSGGKDSASPRYIFTLMSPLTRLIFHPHDDPLLVHEFEDNQKIEPVYYLPIIPMVLVNGVEGIGTGWSTKIPNYNPRDIAENLRRLLDGEKPKVMHPWYKNFKGNVEGFGDKYVISGEAAILPGDKIEITELPVGTWTHNYKENVLEPMLGTDKVKPLISEYREYNTDTTVRFVVSLLPGKLSEIEAEGIHKVFKLQTTISMTCMNAFDYNCCLEKYDKVEEILREFYDLRVKYYVRRKDYLEGQLQAEADKLSNQARFILKKCDKGLVIENKKRKAMVEELIKRGYAPDPIADWKKRASKIQGLTALEDDDAQESEEEEPEPDPKGKPVDPDKAFQQLKEVKKFNYLLGMSMWMLTKEKKDELLKQRDQKLTELTTLKNKTAPMLWREDLDAFLIKLDEVEDKERREELNVNKKTSKAMAGKKNRKSMFDIIPSENGRRVEPKISDDLIKRIQAAEKAKTRKEIKKEYDPDDPTGISPSSGEKKPKARVKKEKPEKAEKPDKVDKAEKTDGLKQTKLTFKKEPKKKKMTFSGSSSGEMSASDAEVEVLVPRERTNARRAATRVQKYKDGSDDSGSDSEPELLDNKIDSDHEAPQTLSISDEDDDFNIKKNPAKKPAEMDSDCLFDSLIEDAKKDEPQKTLTKSKSESILIRRLNIERQRRCDTSVPPKEKAAPKRKLMNVDKDEKKTKKRPARVMLDQDSDDEDSIFDSKKGKKKTAANPKKKAKKKVESDSESDFNISDSSLSD
ncbi:DNA topoisomerase 2 [Bombyx mori]|uniref:DNA topoisomerase 2 n=1 Tax=Bombyx mori TaxID=7091 RepID=TOP2_BOMMO|nr:DNA topoisomerase 2 [Bombyx mori]O16140.1 RecName: Full=DNA topoisomerase 2; AltName: Full=DNA topoisomerase II; Short=TOPOII [Bombyx mori]AAB67168.1 topoisomerase II [Bombyx mori]